MFHNIYLSFVFCYVLQANNVIIMFDSRTIKRNILCLCFFFLFAQNKQTIKHHWTLFLHAFAMQMCGLDRLYICVNTIDTKPAEIRDILSLI